MKVTLVKEKARKRDSLENSPKSKYIRNQKWEIVNESVHWLLTQLEHCISIFLMDMCYAYSSLHKRVRSWTCCEQSMYEHVRLTLIDRT